MHYTYLFTWILKMNQFGCESRTDDYFQNRFMQKCIYLQNAQREHTFGNF